MSYPPPPIDNLHLLLGLIPPLNITPAWPLLLKLLELSTTPSAPSHPIQVITNSY